MKLQMISYHCIDEMVKIETFIFDNEKLFLNKFSNVRYAELVKIWFNSQTVKINYWDTDIGQHYSDEILMKELIEWLSISNYKVPVTAEMIKTVRELTEDTMNNCRKALIVSKGDIELACQLLKTNRIKDYKIE